MAQTHYQSDKLQKLIDWQTMLDLPRYAGGHDEHMKNLFKGAKVIAHWNEGGYQGMVATCVQLEDGRYVIYNDYYGSCSGCDAWEGATDPEIRYLCTSLAISAKIFRTLDDVKDFLENPTKEAEWSSWSNPAENLLKQFPEPITMKSKV